MKHIPYAHQSINEDDINAVVEVLRSDWLTQGPASGQFESAVASYCNAQYAVATCNATSALHIACLSVELGPGDVLWTSPNTFVASATCALMCGAGVDFVDIDPGTFNISVDALKKKLEDTRASGDLLPKVVVAVHFGGLPCDMEGIKQLADIYGFRIIEDASHAIGSAYKDTKTGSCHYSDITVFSFHPAKIITTGEGGMALTDDEAVYNRMVLLRAHGITRNEADMTGSSHGPWYYEQLELGFNYRMSDIHAVLGLSQMKRLDEFVGRRNEMAMLYRKKLADLPVVAQKIPADSYSSYHLYVICVETGEARLDRKSIVEQLHAAGVRVNVHYIPVHLQPLFRTMGYTEGYCPDAEDYYRSTITLPLYYSLTEKDQHHVITTLRGIFE